MKECIEITVTAEDIEEGTPDKSHFCAIALAARRYFRKKMWEVGVASDGQIRVEKSGWSRWWGHYRGKPLNAHYVGGPEVSAFIRDFDKRLPVQPATFKYVQLHVD